MKIFLDDIRNPSDVGLDNTWTIIRDPLVAWQAIRSGIVSHLSLDHDLGDNISTGYDLCKWMAENDKWPTEDIQIHSRNPVGVANMKATIDRYYYGRRIIEEDNDAEK